MFFLPNEGATPTDSRGGAAGEAGGLAGRADGSTTGKSDAPTGVIASEIEAEIRAAEAEKANAKIAAAADDSEDLEDLDIDDILDACVSNEDIGGDEADDTAADADDAKEGGDTK